MHTRIRTVIFTLLCCLVVLPHVVFAATNTDFDLTILPAYQCSDGLDNDFDGLIDYPSDPGCLSAQGLSEYSAPVVPPTSSGGTGVVLLPDFGPLPDLRMPFRPGLVIAPDVMQVDRYATLPNEQGGNRVVPVFTNNRPRFVGKSDLPNAQVVLTVRADIIIRGSTYTNEQGEFAWQAPEFIGSGLFTLLVSVQGPDGTAAATTALEFILDIPTKTPEYRFTDLGSRPTFFETTQPETPLFDIFVKITPASHAVGVGGLVEAVVELINFGTPDSLVDVPLQYYIEDTTGKRLIAFSETRAVKGRLAVKKIFTLPNTLAPGKYVLVVAVPSREQMAYASDTFIVEEVLVPPTTEIEAVFRRDSWMAQVSTAVLTFTVFALYLQYTRVVGARSVKKFHDPDVKKFIP